SWDEQVAIEAIGDGRFRASVDDGWVALQGVNGGIVAAVMVRAAESVLRDADVDPASTLRAATLGYVSGTNVGEVIVDVDVVRRGRSLVTSHVRASQDGKPTVVARFHHSLPWEGVVFSDAPAPLRRPADAVHVDWERPVHIGKVETYVDPATVPF